ncbi:hypothetical protein LAV73_14410 [Lysinibacillus xylanilyticus]|uniref:hypothetical protein n=1 Tax=Lysinibacillus xylanilyticus TaxID=582475 RepID=UPI002B2557C4|nr:hypothetical protein [Lysinibacillus xylanilyticus]MEB2281176.1 hypothetical protein [Lysinibacillus xylanilyticus]
MPNEQNQLAEKLPMVLTMTERIEKAVDSNDAQLMSVPLNSEIATSQLLIHALDMKEILLFSIMIHVFSPINSYPV